MVDATIYNVLRDAVLYGGRYGRIRSWRNLQYVIRPCEEQHT